VRAYAPEATSLPLIVVGTGPAPDTAALREAVGAALRTTTGFDTVAVEAPAVDEDGWRAVAEGAALGAYRFDGYKSVAAAARASHGHSW
jgi:leucyl aminopeptidase